MPYLLRGSPMIVAVNIFEIIVHMGIYKRFMKNKIPYNYHRRAKQQIWLINSRSTSPFTKAGKQICTILDTEHRAP